MWGSIQQKAELNMKIELFLTELNNDYFHL